MFGFNVFFSRFYGFFLVGPPPKQKKHHDAQDYSEDDLHEERTASLEACPAQEDPATGVGGSAHEREPER
jgi:hypothetical protein